MWLPGNGNEKSRLRGRHPLLARISGPPAKATTTSLSIYPETVIAANVAETRNAWETLEIAVPPWPLLPEKG
jgi:hypothetical protein